MQQPGLSIAACVARQPPPGRTESISTRASYPAPYAADPSYAYKEVIQVTDAVYDYILSHTQEPEVLRQLRVETSTLTGREMQVSPEQGRFLAMLVQLMGAERCIEVGVYTGYSSLSVALALPEHGRLVACDRVDLTLAIARKYLRLAGVDHKVVVKHGMAQDSLEELLGEGGADSFDFAFLDADKRNYHVYYELLLKLVRPGGLIVVDNVLWHGRVADPEEKDNKTAYIRRFNAFLFHDTRVTTSMVPIGDGVTLCRKVPPGPK